MRYEKLHPRPEQYPFLKAAKKTTIRERNYIRSRCPRCLELNNYNSNLQLLSFIETRMRIAKLNSRSELLPL